MIYINNNIQEIINFLNIFIIKINNFTLINLKDFRDYLKDRNIINLIIALVVGTHISKISNEITQSIISPIIEKSSIFYNFKLENLTYNILNIEFKIGKLLILIIENILILFIIYIFFWKFSTIEFNDIEKLFTNV
jgi:large-conductance mechanosensitive channel